MSKDSFEHLKRRTKEFALRIIRLTESLPKGRTGEVLGRQLLRCGTSVAANYRAACRAKSPRDFCAKMGIVEEEADESVFWMEMIVDADLIKPNRVAELLQEGKELTAIAVASLTTARRRAKENR